MVISGAGEAATLSTNRYNHLVEAVLFVLKKWNAHRGQHLLQGTKGSWPCPVGGGWASGIIRWRTWPVFMMLPS